MSDNLSITATDGAASFAPVARSPTPAPPASSSSTAQAQFPSPVEHFNAALGIEVMQFAGQDGAAGQTFPSQRQLDAYRDAQPAPSSQAGTIA